MDLAYDTNSPADISVFASCLGSFPQTTGEDDVFYFTSHKGEEEE